MVLLLFYMKIIHIKEIGKHILGEDDTTNEYRSIQKQILLSSKDCIARDFSPIETHNIV